MLHEVPGVTSMMVGTGVSTTVGPGICESIVCKAGAINGVRRWQQKTYGVLRIQRYIPSHHVHARVYGSVGLDYSTLQNPIEILSRVNVCQMASLPGVVVFLPISRQRREVKLVS